jgi:hypothetical protein
LIEIAIFHLPFNPVFGFPSVPLPWPRRRHQRRKRSLRKIPKERLESGKFNFFQQCVRCFWWFIFQLSLQNSSTIVRTYTVSILDNNSVLTPLCTIIDNNNNKNSLVSQYAFFVAGVAGGTAYSVYRKPKNGLGIMMVTGAAGGLVDLAFGWNKACRPQVEAWQRHQQQYEIEKEAKKRES